MRRVKEVLHETEQVSLVSHATIRKISISVIDRFHRFRHSKKQRAFFFCLDSGEVSENIIARTKHHRKYLLLLPRLRLLIAHHSSPSPSHTTHHIPLKTHHSTHTTHHPPLITHHSSHTTRHTPLHTHHSSHTTHHTPLITHHSSHTTHHVPLITHHPSHTTHHTPLITHHSSYTTHHIPLIMYHSSHTTHHTPLATYHSHSALLSTSYIFSFV